MAMARGGLGIKVMCKGRLGGSEIARTEKYRDGKVPLSTFRADVDYGFAEAHTTYGAIGCKVWVYKGDILVKKEQAALQRQREQVLKETGQEQKEAKKEKKGAKVPVEVQVSAESSEKPDSSKGKASS